MYRLAPTRTQLTKPLKTILQWTSPFTSPFVYMGIGQEGFISRNCLHTNCYVTYNRKHIHITKFDVILFAGPELSFLSKEGLPERRSPHQKYVFASIESAANYPVCTRSFNDFFNWTWTYKLESDLRWGYMIIKNINGNVVGPNKIMHWIKQENMRPVTNKVKKILKGKKKIAAWMVSNCNSANNREIYVKELDKILQKKYNLSIDIYGACGELKCSRENETKCFEMIKKDYYFYLSFENSFCEDYVTEKLLNAVQNYAVPIVYGGANYSRFLPAHSYLNARNFKPEMMANKMYKLMKNFKEYVEYFRWTNHYSYHKMPESVHTDEYCSMCALLNDDRKVKQISVYDNLKDWWDPPESLCY
ncbi:glycosyltransferase family 10 (fucosyltransferase) c-term domain-containing protein [Phthorimaea operculella]|nr:glycosyltransferase family 10 (fucosyltransferase) c-term domain-containing protein [Phthorimaea operculella]